MIPMLPIGGSQIWQLVGVAAAVTMFAQQRAAPADPVADLTAKLRRPVRWRLRHPVKALARTRRR